MNDLIGISSDPLAVPEAMAFLSDPAAGGLAIFLGTTRTETNVQGHPLIALDYEAYQEMAGKQFADFAAEARTRWPILRLVILHRVGRVPVAAPSVLVGVSTPHRAESFDACRWLIDTLKATATIWKKQVWS